MDQQPQHDNERQDLPLEFDTQRAPAENAAKAAAPANRPAGAPQPTLIPERKSTPQPTMQRPTPLISPGRRSDALSTQTIHLDDVKVRTVPISAFPGAKVEAPRAQVAYGRCLAEQRKRLNLTMEQVDAATLIRKDYLEALEHEELSKLPPAVYVVAYVRKLGRYYQLPPAQIEELVGELKQHLEYSVPEELLSRLEVNTEPCEENARTMSRIMWSLGIGIPALVIALVLVIVFTTRTSPSPAPTPGQANVATPANVAGRIPESRIEPLLAKPNLHFPELPNQ